MSFNGNNPNSITYRLTPQSADPVSASEGDLQFADGTARAEGVWVFKNAAWVRLAEGTAGALSIRSLSTTQSLLTTDDYVKADVSGGSITLTLPTAIGNSGLIIRVFKSDSSTNSITLDTTASQTINGNSEDFLGTQYQVVSYISDGTNWITNHISATRTVYIKHVESSGVSGGTYPTANTWQTRTLNTVEGDTSFSSLSSNQITLEPGTYDISASSTVFAISKNMIRLREITDTEPVLYGMARITRDNTNPIDVDADTAASLDTRFTITTTRTFQLEHAGVIVNTDVGAFGVDLGLAPAPNTYAVVKITKIA